jgi:anti-sigma factor RsiW
MDCTRCAEDLTAFLDGELSPAESERVRYHLNTCPACAGELQSLRAAARFVRSHQRELEVNPETWRLVQSRITALPQPRPLLDFLAPYRWRLALATAAVVAAVALATLQYRQVQRRNLDDYISQYVQSRQFNRPAPPVFAELDVSPGRGDSRPYNPFAEIQDTLTHNPFRLEDR